jgi:hypothetical protein
MPQFTAATANEFIEQELHQRLRAIERSFVAHAISLSGPLVDGVDDILRKAVEKRSRQRPLSTKLVVILKTEGGYIETVARMVATIRRHYGVVDFVVPNYAYSAGTVFAMSGDSIHMDYYSRLGPIDPQIETQHGRGVSALGHLEKYNALIEKAANGTISTAETQLLIEGFDQAELYHYEQAQALSIALLEEWLAKYKFKNWTETETNHIPVTDEMRKVRAAEIGLQLNDTKRWHSHGYGISMEVLRRDLNLRIDDYEGDAVRCDKIRGYFDLLDDYMLKRAASGTIHIIGDYRSFM